VHQVKRIKRETRSIVKGCKIKDHEEWDKENDFPSSKLVSNERIIAKVRREGLHGGKGNNSSKSREANTLK